MANPSASPQRPALDVVVFGGCVADALHRAENPLLRATTMHGTSNVCSLSVSFGGVGRNVAEACSRLGLGVKLVSVVGDDALGNALLNHTKQLKGVDADDLEVLRGQTTASYTAILDGAGELCVASAVMQILDGQLSTERQILRVPRVMEALQRASWLVVDGNVPKKELEAAIQLVRNINDRRARRQGGAAEPLRVAYDPISATKVLRCLNCLSSMDVIKPNLGELVVLGKQCSLIDAATENMALRVAQAIDAPSPPPSPSPAVPTTTTKATAAIGLADAWASFVTAVDASHASSLSSCSGDRLTATSTANASSSVATCRLLYALLCRVVLGLVRRFPSLTVLCTLGPLGCAVGVGPASMMAQQHGSAEGGPLLRCFPPPEVPKECIRKVTGAGDSFLSGFVFACVEQRREVGYQRGGAKANDPQTAADVVGVSHLDGCIQIANAVAATALTSRHTISHRLSREGVMAAVAGAAAGSNRRRQIKARM